MMDEPGGVGELDADELPRASDGRSILAVPSFVVPARAVQLVRHLAGCAVPRVLVAEAGVCFALLEAVAPFVRVTSWFRDVDSNRLAGGLPASLHLQGCAFDFVVPPSCPREVAEAVTALLERFGRLVWDRGGTAPHWHFEVRG